MDIQFETEKFRKIAADFRLLQKEYGQLAKKINSRLEDLRSAETLETMRTTAGKCHELTGDLKGLLALRLDKNYRLLFRPSEPIPHKPDGGLDWTQVTAIVIVRVEDYHG